MRGTKIARDTKVPSRELSTPLMKPGLWQIVGASVVRSGVSLPIYVETRLAFDARKLARRFLSGAESISLTLNALNGLTPKPYLVVRVDEHADLYEEIVR